MKQDAVTIGVISDGKAGHLNQSLGLAEALERQRPACTIRELSALPRGQALRSLLYPSASADQIDLLIGAGHATHLSLLALSRRARCPSIVLMRPSLPVRLFDLCIQPRHDGGQESPRLWLSDGPLNRIRAGRSRDNMGLILIGGPSPHYEWEPQALQRQVMRICDGSRHWQLSSSRRTPVEFLESVQALGLPNLSVLPVDELPAGWLAEQLPRATSCWVTPDSASMVYEALTAGCAVGVFDLPSREGSRVAAAIADLGQRGLLSTFSELTPSAALTPPRVRFAEAERCATRILERGWL
ncbi:MAG: mitochondrial fission ELM1 family protein [Congregibacter sp.]